MFKKVKDIAVIIKNGLRDGAKNLSGNLDQYFDHEMQGMLLECRIEVDAVAEGKLLDELVICRDRMIRAEKRITVYKSLFFLLIALECVAAVRGGNGIFGEMPVCVTVLAVEMLLFWWLTGKQYRSKRRCSMKAEMLVERRS